MSKIINILVEGKTEVRFVKECMVPFFSDKGIHMVWPVTMATSVGHKGGDVTFKRYKGDVLKVLSGTEEMIVTSLIDYYGLRTDFPGYKESLKFPNVNDKVSFIEKACSDSIDDHRFVPYIQLHEFEGLLFSNKKGFSTIPNLNASQIADLERIVDDFPNPELINNNRNTAPSKRLLSIIPSYSKPFHGSMIALENGGLKTIIAKCPRFRNWVETLVERAK